MTIGEIERDRELAMDDWQRRYDKTEEDYGLGVISESEWKAETLALQYEHEAWSSLMDAYEAEAVEG